MTEHTSKKFDAELEGIRTRVLQMGGMVELQIVKAMEGLGGGDLLLIEVAARMKSGGSNSSQKGRSAMSDAQSDSPGLWPARMST